MSNRIIWIMMLGVAIMIGCNRAQRRVTATPLRWGSSIMLDASLDLAQTASRKAFEKTGFKITEEKTVDSNTWWAVGNMPAAFQSWGESARIVLTREAPEVTKATYYSVRKVSTNVSEDLAGVQRQFFLNLQTAVIEETP